MAHRHYVNDIVRFDPPAAAGTKTRFDFLRMTEENMRNLYVKFFAVAVFTVLAFATSGATDATAAPWVTGVSLRAERLRAINTCPTTVDFYGTITMNGPGTVRYTFERSDGATAPVYTLVFPAAGTKEVRTSWTLGRSYSGYEKLKVISPNRRESSEARFNLNCEGTLIDPPLLPVGSIDIFCPLETARTEMVSRLPEGWWQTPQIGRLVSIGLLTVGGERTLACYYSAYGTRVAVMRNYPEGRTDCRMTGTNRFTCR